MKEARVTIEQMDILRHTAGLDRGNTPYRNYFCAEEGHDSWDALLAVGENGVNGETAFAHITLQITLQSFSPHLF